MFRIVGCTHINAQTAVLVETLVALGAQVEPTKGMCAVITMDSDVFFTGLDLNSIFIQVV